jgi:hypothetical protein
MTRNVEKFTATAITHVAAATTTTARADPPAPDSSNAFVVDVDDARPAAVQADVQRQRDRR